MQDNKMNEALEVAEQAIVGAWFQGNEVEQAQLWIALDIVKAVREQRQKRRVEKGAVHGS